MLSWFQDFDEQISQENSSPNGEGQEKLTFDSRENEGTINIDILKTFS